MPVTDAGSKNGYSFNGWKSSNGGKFADASKADTVFTMPAKDTTITANWVAAKYTLTVDLGGGDGPTVGGSYTEGSVISINAGSKDGFNFSVWSSSNGGKFEDASKAATNFTMPAKDTKITAYWFVSPTPPDPFSNLLIVRHLALGYGQKLNPKNLMLPGAPVAVNWISANANVLDVVNKGGKFTLRGNNVGLTNLTVISYDGKTSTIPVSVILSASAASGISGLKALKLMRAESRTLTPVIKPSDAADKTVFYASTDKSIVTVVNGTVYGIKTGKCQIIALTSSGIKKAVKVTVDKFAAIARISLEPAELTMKKGETFTLKATVSPAAANQKLVWSTKSKKIAAVKNGVVTAKKAGSTVITCKFSNGEKLTCTVTVTE